MRKIEGGMVAVEFAVIFAVIFIVFGAAASGFLDSLSDCNAKYANDKEAAHSCLHSR